MPDSKSWGGQFNTMSPPIQKLGGICPPNPPPRDAPGDKGLRSVNFIILLLLFNKTHNFETCKNV